MYTAECQFDVPPDGVLRGHAYVATLEARIQSLERQLRAKNSVQSTLTPGTTCSDPNDHEGDAPALSFFNQGTEESINGARQDEPLLSQANLHQENNSRETASCHGSTPQRQLTGALMGPTHGRKALSSEITALEMLQGRPFISDIEGDDLPTLPPSNQARQLVDTAYFYTQARYCITDWVQLREWHRDREAIAYTSTQGPVESQTGKFYFMQPERSNTADSQPGAFFIWIIYGIGARLVQTPENSSEAYFARARLYLPAVMGLQNLTTVQALLSLVQYYFRAPTESPIWDIVGAALRLCVRRRYHRKTTSSPNAKGLDPYTIELQKRFFWCAYCFDRCLAILTKLPFGISDSDIDVEIPVDIDDTCTDQEKILDLQMRQAAGDTIYGKGTITTMTAALHHLQSYRIRSRILTNFTGPHAQVPSLTEVEELLSELGQWRQQAPQKQDSRTFPLQNPDRVQTTYLQAASLLIRPILTGNAVDPDVIRLCVEFAAEACESAKAVSLNPQTLPERISVYHCFYCGIALLQCLTIKPTALSPRRSHQAISACLSALAVYTRVLPSVAPFLQLFEDVSNLFVRNDHGSEIHPTSKVRHVLNRIVSSDPSEVSGILQSLSHQDSQQVTSAPTPEPLEMEPTTIQYDSILGGQSSVVLGAGDSMFPLGMPLDISPLYAPDTDLTGLWTGSWLDPSSTEFSQISAGDMME
ncbi:hypothetical protein NUU61_004992 [Penicillium alfredii]|uniref:Xylanolytic transcriptional activator regulatory domain-containing protein n=1 Tax=Penicillium alfredii TaxID=1506179 RepID=A0A9W9F8P6_9EURO|nr:uncharacterized protein NUU61_004992 [Penicillium alfredii]KAJ5095636.1 hypothetical protein NUU61_004992 [Penicillium alfredii]